MLTLLLCISLVARTLRGDVLPAADVYGLVKVYLAADTWCAGLLGMTAGVMWAAAEAIRGTYALAHSGSTDLLLLSVASLALSVFIDPDLWIEAYENGREQQ